MDISVGTAIAIGTAIFTAGGSWFTVRVVQQRQELQREKDLALQAQENAAIEGRVNDRLREYNEKKDDQGRRIGKTEQRISALEGRFQYDDGPPRRRLTAPAGNAIESDDS